MFSQMCIALHVKYPLFLSDINPLNAELNPIRHLLALVGARHIVHVSGIRVNAIWIFLTDFLKKIFNYEISWKILLVGAELSRADGQTDRQTSMTKIIVAFRNFATTPKNGFTICCSFPSNTFFLLRFAPKMFDRINWYCSNSVCHKPLWSLPFCLRPSPTPPPK